MTKHRSPQRLVRSALAALLAILFVPTLCAASGSVRYVTLKQVAQRTDAAVLVQFAEPKVRDVRIAMTPKGKKPEPKKWPDFVRQDRKLKVLRVLFARGGSGPKGTLFVAPGDWRFMLSLHRMYHVENRRKIPIYHRFDGRKALKQLHRKGGKAIVLLQRDKKTGWRVAARFAFLMPSATKRVRAALMAKK
ncbi:MAG: hypothetical protein KC502_13570 [Myxococcales bacterium]|nr:hypothetical protein [Myxococcales bacterium]